jgi:hypothetical protein
MMTKEERVEEFRSLNKRYSRVDGSMIEALIASDFFDAPASVKYHGNYAGGLYDHSRHVYRRLVGLSKLLPDGRIPEDSAFVCGMYHDLCKTFFYKPCKKNVKNPDTGLWEQIDSWEYDDLLPFGHGEKSLHLLSGVSLSTEEALAIRWHMGGFMVGSRGAQEVVDVWKKDYEKQIPPLILFTHLADGFATYIDENEKVEIPAESRVDGAEFCHTLREQLPPIPDGASSKEHYILLFQKYLWTRPGADKLLGYICGKLSDFFTAYASANNHGAYEGGLVDMAIKMFYNLVDLVDYTHWPVSLETIAAVSLLHGLGCIKTFKIETSKRKNQDGEWVDRIYVSKDEELPMGSMGVKSMYISQGFLRPTREEAIALRWIEGALNDGDTACSAAFERFPFAFLAHAAYLMAAYAFLL